MEVSQVGAGKPVMEARRVGAVESVADVLAQQAAGWAAAARASVARLGGAWAVGIEGAVEAVKAQALRAEVAAVAGSAERAMSGAVRAVAALALVA